MTSGYRCPGKTNLPATQALPTAATSQDGGLSAPDNSLGSRMVNLGQGEEQQSLLRHGPPGSGSI